jgi:pimeloyl-ACP methyl ester carboxylesterase
LPYFKTRDNVELFYTTGGSGQPIVFVASAWLSSTMWEFQVPYFVDQGFSCVTYDRRGHGRSDVPWDGYDYDTLAADLASLLEQLDARNAVLVGHSAGCGEIVKYLDRYGAGRVSGIVLAGGTTPFPMKADDNPLGVDRAWMEADLAIRTADRAKWYADNAEGFFGANLPDVAVSSEWRQYMIAQCLQCSPRATAEFFVTGFTTDLRKELAAIQTPALVIHGAHDLQAPLSLCGERTADLLPNGELIVYDNAAHGLFVTHAARMNADILKFVQSGTLDAGQIRYSDAIGSATSSSDCTFIKSCR